MSKQPLAATTATTHEQNVYVTVAIRVLDVPIVAIA
jgi:hypothetical protein